MKLEYQPLTMKHSAEHIAIDRALRSAKNDALLDKLNAFLRKRYAHMPPTPPKAKAQA